MIIQQGRVLTSSMQILDGIVKNVDIEAAAGIEGSKLQEFILGTNAGVIPSTGILNAHIVATAAIVLSKLEAGTHGDFLFRNSSGVLVPLVAGTLNQVMMCKGAGADPEWGDVGLSKVVASDTLIQSADTERTQSGDTDYHTKKVFVIRHAGTVRIKYSVKNNGSYSNSKIVDQFGNELSTGTRTSTSWAEDTENIEVFPGMKINIQIQSASGGNVSYIKDARMYYTKSAADDSDVITD